MQLIASSSLNGFSSINGFSEAESKDLLFVDGGGYAGDYWTAAGGIVSAIGGTATLFTIEIPVVGEVSVGVSLAGAIATGIGAFCNCFGW
jgi:6-phosphogluconate dehydrogenase (decarboxylating)